MASPRVLCFVRSCKSEDSEDWHEESRPGKMGWFITRQHKREGRGYEPYWRLTQGNGEHPYQGISTTIGVEHKGCGKPKWEVVSAGFWRRQRASGNMLLSDWTDRPNKVFDIKTSPGQLGCSLPNWANQMQPRDKLISFVGLILESLTLAFVELVRFERPSQPSKSLSSSRYDLAKVSESGVSGAITGMSRCPMAPNSHVVTSPGGAGSQPSSARKISRIPRGEQGLACADISSRSIRSSALDSFV